MTPIAKKIKALANSKYYTTKTSYTSDITSKYLCLAAQNAKKYDVLVEVEAYMDQLGLNPKHALLHSLIPASKPQTVEEVISYNIAVEETLSFIKTNVYDDWDNRPATLEELRNKYKLWLQDLESLNS